MRLVMTLLSKDSVDFTEHNLEYHLAQGVDHFIVTDNGSSDGTREVLEDYRRDGVLRVIDEPGQDYQQGAWVSRMAVSAFEDFGADWVIHADPDEFWWPGAGDLKQAFSEIDGSVGTLVVPRCNFLPSERLTGPFWRQMIYREVLGDVRPKVVVDDQGKMSLADFDTGGPLPARSTSLSGAGGGITWPKVAHRGCSRVDVRRGNHAVFSTELGSEAFAQCMLIFHFPHHTFERMERIASQFGQTLALNSDLRNVPWAKMYAMHQEGTLFDWYSSLPKIETDAERLMELGLVTEDTRLRDFFQSTLAATSP